MRAALTAIALSAAAMLAAPQAQADVTYDFVFKGVSGPNGSVPVSDMMTQSITFTDAIVQSDYTSFSLSACSAGAVPTAATLQTCVANSGFVSAQAGLGSAGYSGPGDVDLLSGTSDFSLTFDQNGTLSGFMDLTNPSDSTGLHISGTEYSWSGFIGSDLNSVCSGNVGYGGNCLVGGYWLATNLPLPVPAPSSLALLAGALGMLGVVMPGGRGAKA